MNWPLFASKRWLKPLRQLWTKTVCTNLCGLTYLHQNVNSKTVAWIVELKLMHRNVELKQIDKLRTEAAASKWELKRCTNWGGGLTILHQNLNWNCSTNWGQKLMHQNVNWSAIKSKCKLKLIHELWAEAAASKCELKLLYKFCTEVFCIEMLTETVSKIANWSRTFVNNWRWLSHCWNVVWFELTRLLWRVCFLSFSELKLRKYVTNFSINKKSTSWRLYDISYDSKWSPFVYV